MAPRHFDLSEGSFELDDHIDRDHHREPITHRAAQASIREDHLERAALAAGLTTAYTGEDDLEDEDGVDGPFDLSFAKAMREDGAQ